MIRPRGDLTDMRFDRMRIPARCLHCGVVRSFYYHWLRSAGGFDCPQCGQAVTLNLEDVDAAVERLKAAAEALGRAAGRLAIDPSKQSPEPQPPRPPRSG